MARIAVTTDLGVVVAILDDDELPGDNAGQLAWDILSHDIAAQVACARKRDGDVGETYSR